MARVVLTQPLPRVEVLGRVLAERGHEIAILSATRIEPLAVGPIQQRLSGVDWVIAVSPAAVEALAHGLKADGPDGRAGECRWPDGPALALIGPGSLRALEQTRLRIPAARLLVPEGPPFDAATLMGNGPFGSPTGLRVLVARGEDGREDWIGQLRRAGAQVEILELYGRRSIAPPESARTLLKTWLREHVPVACVFTQAGSVRSLLELPEALGLAGVDGCGTALVIHARIAEVARTAGFHRVRLIDPGANSIAAALE